MTQVDKYVLFFFGCFCAYTLAPCLHNCFRMPTRNGKGAYAGTFTENLCSMPTKNEEQLVTRVATRNRTKFKKIMEQMVGFDKVQTWSSSCRAVALGRVDILFGYYRVLLFWLKNHIQLLWSKSCGCKHPLQIWTLWKSWEVGGDYMSHVPGK